MFNVVLALLTLALLTIPICMFVSNYHQTSTKLDKLCQDLGYNQETDYDDGLNQDVSKVECDHKKIYPVIEVSSCIKYDKWGDCQKSDYYYVIKEVNQ